MKTETDTPNYPTMTCKICGRLSLRGEPFYGLEIKTEKKIKNIAPVCQECYKKHNGQPVIKETK